jgi:hypothetical protein
MVMALSLGTILNRLPLVSDLALGFVSKGRIRRTFPTGPWVMDTSSSFNFIFKVEINLSSRVLIMFFNPSDPSNVSSNVRWTLELMGRI